jgi:dihydroflavonol-4-reductase
VKETSEKPLLLTGGTGFLGAHVLLSLTQRGHLVRATRRKGSQMDFVKRVFAQNGAAEAFKHVQWIETSLEDIFEIEDAMQGVEAVFHVAGMVSFSGADRNAMHRTNVELTRMLINEALNQGVKAFGYVSSIAALGRSHLDEDIDESRPWKRDPANTPYGISKQMGEMEVWRGHEEGLKVFIINPSVILGHAIWNTGTGQLFNSVYRGLSFYPPGATGFVGVKDCAEAFVMLWESEHRGQRYILNAENLSWEQVLKQIAAALNVSPPTRKAGPLLLRLAQWGSAMRHFPGPNRGPVTAQTRKNAQRVNRYFAHKFTQQFSYSFTPIDRIIRETAEIYRNEIQKG